MKKVLSILLVVVTMLTFSVTALAANVEFVPSIENKGAPTVVDSNVTVVVTPVGEAEKSTTIAAEAKAALLKAYDELSAAGASLSALCKDLDAAVAAALGEGKTANNLVVRDLFDVTATNLTAGTALNVTFKLNVAADQYVAAMVYNNGAWSVVKAVNNGDGTVSCTMDNAGAVALMVPSTASTTPGGAPETGDNSNLTLWVSVMAVSLAAIVALVVFNRKRSAVK